MWIRALPLSDKPPAGPCYPGGGVSRSLAGASRAADPVHRPCENVWLSPLAGTIMDNEQINAIGAALADLSARTEQLRGYL